MTLFDAKLNTDCVVKEINIQDKPTKLRLMELGLNVNTKIKVKNKSILKKTLLIIFNSTCFTLKDVFAKQIVVNYV